MPGHPQVTPRIWDEPERASVAPLIDLWLRSPERQEQLARSLETTRHRRNRRQWRTSSAGSL